MVNRIGLHQASRFGAIMLFPSIKVNYKTYYHSRVLNEPGRPITTRPMQAARMIAAQRRRCSSRRTVFLWLNFSKILVTQLRELFGAIVAAEGLQRTAHTLEALLDGLHVIEQLADGP